MAYATRKSNRTFESERMLKRCIELEPTFTPAYIELARLGGSNNPNVGSLLAKVASLNPNDAYYTTLYAHWLLNKGYYIKASHYYWKSLYISASHQESALGISRILRKYGQSSRLFQFITRWQYIVRLKVSQTSKLPHIYLHEWQLRIEFEKKAKLYDNHLQNTINTCVEFHQSTNTFTLRTTCLTNNTSELRNNIVLWTNYSPMCICSNNPICISKHKQAISALLECLLDTA